MPEHETDRRLIGIEERFLFLERQVEGMEDALRGLRTEVDGLHRELRVLLARLAEAADVNRDDSLEPPDT